MTKLPAEAYAIIEALLRLGIAARFVSGYLAMPPGSAHGYVCGGSTHAWVQVYLPSAGWIENIKRPSTGQNVAGSAAGISSP